MQQAIYNTINGISIQTATVAASRWGGRGRRVAQIEDLVEVLAGAA